MGTETTASTGSVTLPGDVYVEAVRERDRLRGLLHEVYRDGILPQVLKGKVWDAING